MTEQQENRIITEELAVISASILFKGFSKEHLLGGVDIYVPFSKENEVYAHILKEFQRRIR